MQTLKSILIPAGIGLGILVLLGLAGSSLVLVREAASVHPVLGWATGALLLVAVGLLAIYPAVRVLRLPRALVRPHRTREKAWRSYIRAYARRLAANRRLREEHDDAALLETAEGDALETVVERAIEHLDKQANAVVCRHAAAVFTSTAISQSGRLDAAIVLSAQFRMIQEVAEVYLQRPSPRELGLLYANVGGTAFLAGEMQDSELLAVLGAPVTAAATGVLPGSGPLVTLLVNSLLDGSANAFLTLRIGVLARRYCGVRPTEDRRRLLRSASLEAASLLGSVVGAGAQRVAAATRKLIVGRTVRGTARAARGVVDLGTSLFDKVAGIAGKAGSAAVESTSQSLRFLNDSLRFWESVARKADESVLVEEGAAPD